MVGRSIDHTGSTTRTQPGSAPPGASALASLSTFVGRDTEVEALEELLARARLVTITGPGGAGKTRLALEVAGRVAVASTCEVATIDLAPLRDPDLVAPAIASALGLRAGGADPDEERIIRYLADRPVLLVLDNLEQLDGCAGIIVRLLDACPLLRVLATSRVPLNVSVEHRFPIGGLHLPDSGGPPDALLQEPALALLAERACALDPAFSPRQEDAPILAEICRRLDGIPLAIELAACRLRFLSPTAVLARLDHSLDLLRGGPVDAPDRQRTMRDTIAWSVALLPTPAAALLPGLGVFSGGFDLPAALAVAAPGIAASEGQLLDLLALLTDHSLLLVCEGTDGEPRFSMLEPIREWAIEHLDDEAAVRDRHLEVFQRIAQVDDTRLLGPDHAAAARHLRAEVANLREALGWAQRAGRASALLGLCAALGYWWRLYGDPREGRAWLERATAQVDSPSHTRARALNALARLVFVLDGPLDGNPIAEQARVTAKAIGDDGEEARSLWWLANHAFDKGDVAGAAAGFDEALALARRSGAADVEADALIGRGIVAAWGQDDARTGAHMFNEALGVARATGDAVRAGYALIDLAFVRSHAFDDREAAERMLSEAAAIYQDVGDDDHLAWALVGLAQLETEDSRLDVARATLARCLGLTSRSWSPSDRVTLVEIHAQWLGMAGMPEESLRAWSAVEHARVDLGLTPSWWERELAETWIAIARRAAGEPRATLAWADGAERGIDAALGLAVDAMQATDLGRQRPVRVRLRGGELTGREVEVLGLVGEGCSDGEIAERLGITKRTASVHVANIKGKLGTTSRVETALEARRLGLTGRA